MRTCLTNGTYRVVLCLYSGRAKPFSSFSWGGGAWYWAPGVRICRGTRGHSSSENFQTWGLSMKYFLSNRKVSNRFCLRLQLFRISSFSFFFSLILPTYLILAKSEWGWGGGLKPPVPQSLLLLHSIIFDRAQKLYAFIWR